MLLVLWRYMPAVYLSALDSDNIQIPLLFHDVVELGHKARDWVWGGHSDVFPDITLVFLLESILRKGMLSLQLASGIFLAAYTGVATFLYRQSGGRNAAVFGAAVLLFFVLLLVNFELHDGMEFISISSFVVPMHTSVAIMALACFAICQRAAVYGAGKSLWALPALCFATALSNDLFLVIFMGPMLAALVVARVFYPARLRVFPLLIAIVFIPCAAGHFLARPLSPFQIDPGPFTHFHSAPALAAWREFERLSHSRKESFAIFAALDVLFVAGVTAFLLLQFFKPAEQRIPPAVFMLLSFSAWVIACNWGAVILTGNFTGVLAARYTRLAMLLPVFHALGWLNHLIPWSRAGNRAGVAALSLLVSACALYLRPAPSAYYMETRQLIPVIRREMDAGHIQAGLADYWYANMIAFLSHETLPVRAVNPDGSLFHWVNPIGWYAGNGDSSPPPRFGFIVIANLNPDDIRRRYGAPSQIVPGPGGNDLWIFPEDKSIVYSPVFSALSNDPVNEYRSKGVLLPSLTGKPEGGARVARSGRDAAGLLVFGPYPFLQPAMGRYRISIFHTYLSAPDKDKPVIFQVTYSARSSRRILDERDIPFIDNTRREFVSEIRIPDGERDPMQISIKYSGSGDIRIDSLLITYLGP